MNVQECLNVPVVTSRQFRIPQGYGDKAATSSTVPILECRDVTHIRQSWVRKTAYSHLPVFHPPLLRSEFVFFGRDTHKKKEKMTIKYVAIAKKDEKGFRIKTAYSEKVECKARWEQFTISLLGSLVRYGDLLFLLLVVLVWLVFVFCAGCDGMCSQTTLSFECARFHVGRELSCGGESILVLFGRTILCKKV